MEINLFNQYGNVSFDVDKIIEDVKLGFQVLLPNDKEVGLVLVTLEQIHQMNNRYRLIDTPTDVLSFENEEEEDYLGDVFVCVDKALEQAKDYQHSVEREFAFLLIHGILHLMGYDHLNPQEEKVMFQKQDELLEIMNYTRSM